MEDDKYKKVIIEKSKPIYEYLSKLSVTPLDKGVTQSIWKLADEIRQEND